MSGENSFLSKSEFAASQGWSPSYVTKLKDQGRLVMSPDGRKVNVSETVAMLSRTKDLGKDHVRNFHQNERTEKHVTAHTAPSAPPESDSGSSDPKYWAAKARREDALADLANLELEKKKGNLVERERVESAAFATGRMLRDAILGLPTQLAPELANTSDAFQIELRMREALRSLLDEMAKMTVDDLTKAMEPTH